MCFGILVAQESINTFVHTEYDYRIISMKDVISYYFVFLCGKIMIENGFSLLILEIFQWNESEAVISYQNIDASIGKVQPFLFFEHLFKVRC